MEIKINIEKHPEAHFAIKIITNDRPEADFSLFSAAQTIAVIMDIVAHYVAQIEYDIYGE